MVLQQHKAELLHNALHIGCALRTYPEWSINQDNSGLVLAIGISCIWNTGQGSQFSQQTQFYLSHSFCRFFFFDNTSFCRYRLQFGYAPYGWQDCNGLIELELKSKSRELHCRPPLPLAIWLCSVWLTWLQRINWIGTQIQIHRELQCRPILILLFDWHMNCNLENKCDDFSKKNPIHVLSLYYLDRIESSIMNCQHHRDKAVDAAVQQHMTRI
jgi:hypothetical protein